VHLLLLLKLRITAKMTEMRRSVRARQQTKSIYDEAKKKIEEKVADLAEE
jgi:hypothetical protein